MGLLKGPDIVGEHCLLLLFFFLLVNQSLGHHLESEEEQNAPNLSLKLFTAPHSARCVMGRGGSLLCRYSTFPASSFRNCFNIYFFWPKLLFSLYPKPFFLSSQQKRDETLSIRLHLLLLRKQNPLEMKHLVKCSKPHSNNSLPQRDFSSLSTLSLRGHAGTDASLRLCKIHSGKQILTTRCVCALCR